MKHALYFWECDSRAAHLWIGKLDGDCSVRYPKPYFRSTNLVGSERWQVGSWPLWPQSNQPASLPPLSRKAYLLRAAGLHNFQPASSKSFLLPISLNPFCSCCSICLIFVAGPVWVRRCQPICESRCSWISGNLILFLGSTEVPSRFTADV